MRWLPLTTALVLALLTVEAEAAPKIGVSWPSLAGFSVASDSEMIRGTVAGSLGTVVETDARMSAAKQILDLRGLIEAKVGAIIVSAVDARAIEPVVRAALTAGIDVIAYERPIDVPGVFTISFNQTDVGRLQALALHAARPRGDWVLLKGDFDDPQTAHLYAGQMSVLKDSINAGLIRIAGEAYTPGGLSLNARRVFANILDDSRNRVDAVLTPDDVSAEAAVAVLSERGLTGSVAIVGQGGDPATLNRIARGLQTATIWEDHSALARKAADIALRLANGASPRELGVAKSASAGWGTSYELHLQPFTITIDTIGLALTAGWIDAARLCEGVPSDSLPECD
jgi:D-xylose transport system substrate-binding protein